MNMVTYEQFNEQEMEPTRKCRNSNKQRNVAEQKLMDLYNQHFTNAGTIPGRDEGDMYCTCVGSIAPI